MKKIFAFAMALVSMAAVMTSCSNDETDFIQQPRPTQNITEIKTLNPQTVTGDYELVMPVTDVQAEIVDYTFSVTINNKTTSFTLADMSEIKVRIPDFDNDALGTTKVLSYRIPGNFTEADLKNINVERTAQLKPEGVAKYWGQDVNIYNVFRFDIVKPNEHIDYAFPLKVHLVVELDAQENVDMMLNNMNTSAKAFAKYIRKYN